jgi:RNA polymerase sigma factor (TIGR02999 family)
VLLGRLAAGDAEAGEPLAAAVIDRLEVIAQREMRRQNRGVLDGLTLEPRVLADDALLRVLEAPVDFENRRHFFAYATQIIVRSMIDYQRSRRAQRRGGGQLRITLDDQLGGAVEIERLPPILEELEELDPRQAEVVRLRVFWGASMEQIAEYLGVSKSSVERDWRFARRWLAVELRDGGGAKAG